MRTIDQFNFCNQKVIIRVDFNVPIDKNTVTDTSRIEAAKQTIDKICSDGGSCILVSHLGRPNGFQDDFSMKKIIDSVEKVLGKKVLLSNDVIGEDSILKASNLKPREVLLLENVRFHKEETEGDLNFAKQLSQLGDCYVNDAFGTAHRAHASTTIISNFFTNKFFGKLLEKEVLAIKKVMSSGQKPVLAILGGAKISSKIPILKNIIEISEKYSIPVMIHHANMKESEFSLKLGSRFVLHGSDVSLLSQKISEDFSNLRKGLQSNNKDTGPDKPY